MTEIASIMKVYFVTHSTTYDNEAGIASGHNDVELSELGKKQAVELSEKLKEIAFDIVFTSSLKRSIDTAKIAFGDRYPVISDPRLDELNLGNYNGAKAEIVNPMRLQHIEQPFPNGESYKQRLQMMREFLEEVKQKYAGKNILIIGHRATQWSLDVLLGDKTFEVVIPKPFVWQTYWEYELK